MRIIRHIPSRVLFNTIFVSVNILMASTRYSLSRSVQPILKRPRFSSSPRFAPKALLKSYPCPLWSSSFSFCLQTLHHSTSPYLSSSSSSFSSCSSFSPPSMASSFTVDDSIGSNPLLQDFDFPPFDIVEAKHVRPGIRALLKKVESDLDELEKTVEPSWPKLVEPLEKIVDRLTVVWGMVNHLKAVKDSAELRAAIEEVQPEKVKFQLRLGQSKPIYNAFKAIKESPDWQSLSEARKRIVDAQIKEAVLNGVSLEDDKREQFNKIQQELERLSHKFSENVLDATKK
ncbi:hypothetical protein Golob_007661, partial [Gossypium lobatum]|nr:hypothetical protein [Gossypium lobatum]